ncbi:MAG: hypothetical protein RLZZ522_2036 [Verrucomicrobiota bacterium]
MDEPTHNHGVQPLDELMERWHLTNHELVNASTEQLNHKQVQKARKGRHLTLHLMQKVMRAFNAAVAASLAKTEQASLVAYPHRQLFNYAKGHDSAWAEPNEALIPNPPP